MIVRRSSNRMIEFLSVKNKYNAKKVTIDGYKFDSKIESKRYERLRLLAAAREITNFVVHPSYPIVINGKHICNVILDFSYEDRGKLVLEDVKGFNTAISNLKRKLVEAVHGVNVVLIRKT